MAMGPGGGRAGAISEINMTPMIDVLLVLLIVFMVIQQGLLRNIGLQIPPPREAGARREGRQHFRQSGDRELAEHRRSILRANTHRHRPDVLLEHDPRRLAGERNLPDRREHMGRAHRGMPGKRNLPSRREDAHAPGVGRIIGRKDEGRLRVVELASDRMHLLCSQPARIRQHRKLIAAKWCGGEDIGGEVLVGWHKIKSEKTGRRDDEKTKT
jgi:hypothetical protein